MATYRHSRTHRYCRGAGNKKRVSEGSRGDEKVVKRRQEAPARNTEIKHKHDQGRASRGGRPHSRRVRPITPMPKVGDVTTAQAQSCW